MLSHDLVRIAKRAGLERVRFHDLRHTFASLILLRRAKPKVISEALGHSSVAFTMDIYSHIIEGMQSDAMALLYEVLPVGVSRRINANLLKFSFSRGGGIGRRSGLKIRRRNPCGFESHSRHQGG